MAGLSGNERTGCTKLLSLMTESDLRSLFETVTNKKIEVGTARGAVEAIMTYSSNAAELLKRRKVQREIIFQYLAKEGIVMPTNSDKPVLVQRTLEYWISGKELHRPGPDIQPTVIKTEIQPTVIKTETTVDQSSEQFCRWFFELLNSQNPSLGQEPQDWGPKHFWIDAVLHLRASTVEQRAEEIQGAEGVHQRLLSLVKDERLFLNPNLEPHGHRLMSSPHGLVLVAVAGTVHRDARCLGVFEQVFGLIRPPMGDAWKIKFTDLRVQGLGTHDGAAGMSPAVTCNLVELHQKYRTML